MQREAAERAGVADRAMDQAPHHGGRQEESKSSAGHERQYQIGQRSLRLLLRRMSRARWTKYGCAIYREHISSDSLARLAGGTELFRWTAEVDHPERDFPVRDARSERN